MGKTVAQFLLQKTDGVFCGGYIVDENGVHCQPTDANEEYGKLVSSIPIVPTAIVQNEDADVEKVELSYYKFGRWNKRIVDRATVSNTNQIVKLSNLGIEVNTGTAKLLVSYIASVIGQSLLTMPRKIGKSSMGWLDNGGFAPYADGVVFDGEANFKHLYRAITTSGERETWIDFTGKLRANKAIRLTMAASFASPLISLVSENPFVFMLWGKSGTAKTVALMVAMSVWGNPAIGKMTRTLNMTTNAMLTTAAFLGNIPFAGDELQTIKNRWHGNFDELIMCVTEGINRGRMTYDEVRETLSWKCSFLFTGEEPATKQSSGGGVKNRVIEYEVSEKLVDDGNAVADLCRTHYGHAGKEFVANLNADDVKAKYKQTYHAIIDKVSDTTEKQAGAMSLMLTADELARAMFWQDEDALTIDDVRAYLRSNEDVDVAERAYQYICAFVSENVANFSADAKPVFGIFGENATSVYVNKSVLRRVLDQGGFDFDAVKAAWQDRLFIKRSTNSYTVTKRICGVVTRCVCLRLPSMDDAEIDSIFANNGADKQSKHDKQGKQDEQDEFAEFADFIEI